MAELTASITRSSSISSVNLTSLGGDDYLVGRGDNLLYNYKSGGSIIGTPSSNWSFQDANQTPSGYSVSGTDGDPTSSFTYTTLYGGFTDSGQTWQVTISGVSTATRTLKLFWSNGFANASVKASLSDASVSDLTIFRDDGIGSGDYFTYDLQFSAGSSGQSLTLTVTTLGPNCFIGWLWVSSEESGSTIVDSDGSSTGAATTSGVGVGINTTVGASVGVSATNGTAAAVISGVGSADGVATVSGDTDTIIAGVGASNGVAAVSGVGSAIVGADGASASAATVSGVSAAINGSVGSSDGVATIDGQGDINSPGGQGIADGVANVDGQAAYIVSVEGSSTASSTASGVGEDAAAPAPEPEPPVPYTRNSGTIEENFVVDYGDQQLDPYKYKQVKLPKRAKKAQNTAKDNPIRSIIVEATGTSTSICNVVGRSAYSNSAFKSYKGQLVRTKREVKLDKSSQAMLDLVAKLHNVDIHITPKG